MHIWESETNGGRREGKERGRRDKVSQLMMRDYKIGGVNECCMPPISLLNRESTAAEKRDKLTQFDTRLLGMGNLWNQKNITSTDWEHR